MRVLLFGRFAPLWCRTAKTFGDPTAVIGIGPRELVDHLDLDDLRAFAQRTDNPEMMHASGLCSGGSQRANENCRLLLSNG